MTEYIVPSASENCNSQSCICWFSTGANKEGEIFDLYKYSPDCPIHGKAACGQIYKKVAGRIDLKVPYLWLIVHLPGYPSTDEIHEISKCLIAMGRKYNRVGGCGAVPHLKVGDNHINLLIPITDHCLDCLNGEYIGTKPPPGRGMPRTYGSFEDLKRGIVHLVGIKEGVETVSQGKRNDGLDGWLFYHLRVADGVPEQEHFPKHSKCKRFYGFRKKRKKGISERTGNKDKCATVVIERFCQPAMAHAIGADPDHGSRPPSHFEQLARTPIALCP